MYMVAVVVVVVVVDAVRVVVAPLCYRSEHHETSWGGGCGLLSLWRLEAVEANQFYFEHV